MQVWEVGKYYKCCFCSLVNKEKEEEKEMNKEVVEEEEGCNEMHRVAREGKGARGG